MILVKLFDISVIIHMIKSKKFEPGAISVITLIEIIRGLNKTKREKVKEKLETAFEIIQLDN